MNDPIDTAIPWETGTPEEISSALKLSYARAFEASVGDGVLEDTSSPRPRMPSCDSLTVEIPDPIVTAFRIADERAALAGVAMECAWCGRMIRLWILDEDGDPQCQECARVAALREALCADAVRMVRTSQRSAVMTLVQRAPHGRIP